MRNDDDAQQQYGATKPRMCDVLDDAARKYYTKTHVDRGLPQICEVTSNSPGLDLSILETSTSTGQIVDFLSDFDNDPENNDARLSVTDADVTKHIQYLRNANPELVASQIEQEGEDLYRQHIKHELQTRSIRIALENRFGGYDPEPADKHYQLWKEYCLLVASASAGMIEEIIEEQCIEMLVASAPAGMIEEIIDEQCIEMLVASAPAGMIEEIIDEQCIEKLVCEVDDESISQNERAYDWYTDRIENHRKLHKKSIDELHGRLLLAEKNMRQQVWASTAAARTTTRRPPIRARRAHAGHGATAKSGDDGDGDGGDGEPPRPRSARSPTPPLHHSLTHSLIAGGAQ